MSDSTAKRLPSLIRPIAIPATCALTGTPASISARLPPQTEAIDEEPLDSVISETTRIEMRSEEHTSELQSRLHLVCRLLLEKKNVTYYTVYDSVTIDGLPPTPDNNIYVCFMDASNFTAPKSIGMASLIQLV